MHEVAHGHISMVDDNCALSLQCLRVAVHNNEDDSSMPTKSSDPFSHSENRADLEFPPSRAAAVCAANGESGLARKRFEVSPANPTGSIQQADAVQASLARLLSRWVNAVHDRFDRLPCLQHDDEWPSSCIVAGPDAHGLVQWQPLAREHRADFSGIEGALETRLHADIQSFYGSFYSNPLPVRAADGPLTLLQVWSDRDFDRLLENLLGHAFGQRRAGQALSVFIAVTDEDDLNLCVNNESGNVVLERPGEEPLREIAPSLAVFLDALEPAVEDDGAADTA
jgi:SecY interacting protein Syd